MVKKRKKILIDGMDKEILRKLNSSRRGLNANVLSKRVGMSASGIRPRLDNLKHKGIIRPIRIQGTRSFNRQFGKQVVRIKAPRSITWGIDLKKSRRKKR